MQGLTPVTKSVKFNCILLQYLDQGLYTLNDSDKQRIPSTSSAWLGPGQKYNNIFTGSNLYTSKVEDT